MLASLSVMLTANIPTQIQASTTTGTSGWGFGFSARSSHRLPSVRVVTSGW